MSYLVLARKYRPQSFADLVGQEHVTTTLKNALAAGRVAHAYIFSGPRGCGKTSAARILAKALNCVNGPTPAPCGACDRCQDIASGASLDDVLEIDGASNGGIAQIRELRDTVKYTPSRARYRIIIIDEAHQVSDAGFNALLKTLEEPPPHAVFMMATTEAQKIPATILSRCQRFQLKPIPPALIQKQLKTIALAEKRGVDESAVLEVSLAANGSLRDALSLLDQVTAYSPQGVTGQDIRNLLGLLPREAVKRFAEALESGSDEKVLQAVAHALAEGHDLFQLAHDLTDHWHRLFLIKAGVDSAHTPNADELNKEASRHTLDELERNLEILSHAAEQMRRSESPRLTLELACLELSKKSLPVDELLERLETLEQNLRQGAPAEPLKKKADVVLTSAPENTPVCTPEPEIAPRPSAPAGIVSPASAQAPTPAAPADRPSQEEFRPLWNQAMDVISRQKPSLEGTLRNSRWTLENSGTLKIHCANEFEKTIVLGHLPLITETLKTHTGTPISVHCAVSAAGAAPTSRILERSVGVPADDVSEAEVVDDDEPSAEAPSEEAAHAPAPPLSASAKADMAVDLASLPDAGADMDPGLKKVLEKFPGKLKKIATHAAP